MKSASLKEIEVKARIKTKPLLLKKLKELGIKLSKPITQKDTVFLPLGISYEDIKSGTVALRIREQKDKTLFTLKQRQEVELSAIEKELEIGDKNQLQDIIKILGFYEWVKISKTRLKSKYGEYEICIDSVEGLGDFIEVEKISKENGLAVQEELFLFLESLGVKREDRERKGYDTLIHYLNNSVRE